MAIPVLRRMSPDDLDAVIEIEKRSFKQPWSRSAYLMDLLHNEMATYLVLLPGGGDEGRLPPVLAYGGSWLVMDEAHVATLATHPNLRSLGLGQVVLLGLLDQAIEDLATRSTLEVRVSNLSAQHLYQKLGYAVVGTRRHYYQDGEDAYIMTTAPLDSPAMRTRLEEAHAQAQAKLAAHFDHAAER
jgi:ribosomal-protein-alanine N-acetyltransferase